MEETHRIIRPDTARDTECVERESGHERRVRIYIRKIECNQRLFEPGTVVPQQPLPYPGYVFDPATMLEELEGLECDAND